MKEPDLRSGDLVWVDFDPAFGHEQSGRRPALVMSASGYNKHSSSILVCPVTSRANSWPFRIELPASGKIAGWVLFDQIKSIDKRRVKSGVIGHVPATVFEEVRTGLNSIVAFDPPGE